MLVDFMIIGAQKSGSTSLAHQLAQHPSICFCKVKEPYYFSETMDWKAGLEKYHSLYSPTDGQLCGEASQTYTFLPEYSDTPSRLYEYNPELKLIYIMRQPVERIISHYSYFFVRRRVKKPPEIVLEDPSYMNYSRYGVQIRHYLELFKRENILLLIFEEYISHPLKTLEQIAKFLAIPPEPFRDVDLIPKNKSVGQKQLTETGRKIASHMDRIYGFGITRGLRPITSSFLRKEIRRRLYSPFLAELKEKPEFSPELKKTLWRFLEDDVRSVEELTGRRLDIWRRGYE